MGNALIHGRDPMSTDIARIAADFSLVLSRSDVPGKMHCAPSAAL